MSTPQQHGYWKSLAEYAAAADPCVDPQSERWQEFPDQADIWPPGADRRRFLQLMGASLSLAGVAGCTGNQSTEEIVPYVDLPEGIVPGETLRFATSLVAAGDVEGVVVESLTGRPLKIEGNPLHPASRGATSAAVQAEILGLYDPDRSQAVKRGGEISTWDEFFTSIARVVEPMQQEGGSRLRLLTESVVSPTLAAQLDQLLAKFPGAQLHQHAPVSRQREIAGLKQAFGKPLTPVYQFRQADVILVLDADPLGMGPGHVRYARDFSDRRQTAAPSGESPTMPRLYAVESTPTITGGKADHRLPLAPDGIEAFVRALAAELGVIDAREAAAYPATVPEAWRRALIDDLKNYRPSQGDAAPLLIAGPWASMTVHTLVHRINAYLGAVGRSVVYIDPPEQALLAEQQTLEELADAMHAGEVDVLLILGGNPAYTAPADLDFASALEKVPLRIHHSLYVDETSLRCHWHLPAAHLLESWSDAWAYNGVASPVQPLIAPLYDGRSTHEVLAGILRSSVSGGREIIRAHWAQTWGLEDDDPVLERRWKQSLHDGIFVGTDPQQQQVSPDGTSELPAARTADPGADSLQLVLRPDPSIWDGSLANNGWLQELPKPFTKLTWDNAALFSPATAQRLGIQDEQVVTLSAGERQLRAAALVLPGQADRCVTLHLGYGRNAAGRVGNGAGVNAYQLRTTFAPWVVDRLAVDVHRERYPLARTQNHHDLHDRELIRAGTLAEFTQHPEHPDFMHSHHGEIEGLTFYPEREYEGQQWGMSVDLTACTGCNACVIACQAENNIPVVGKEQVQVGREMHWIRVDHYYHGEPDNPMSHQQPVMCMHCEQAPCEVVCPVAATVHTDEGLNAMVYNRCVGTRYCSNNCPYKVRRFNFLQYTDRDTPVLDLLRNPEVTVRNRGVMEKCTYCVQRIRHGSITAEREGRPVRDGEIQTACQEVCPSQAIRFGNINDASSRIAQLRESPLKYSLLEELNARPRTTYLAEIRNPNPSLV